MTQTDIYNLIEDEGVEFIRLQFTDIFGTLKNFAVTPGQLDQVFRAKCSFEGSAVYGEKYEVEDKLFVRPELDSFTILPWRPQQAKVAKMVCDVCNEDGSLFTGSSRYVLKQVLHAQEEKGYSFLVDPENEFFLFHTDENGLPTTTSHEKAGYLDVGPMDFGENARREIVLTLEDMGFEVESSHHESGPAQHEIDFKEADALSTADAIQTFRFAVRSIAKRFGLYATFMPKPKSEDPGSGMHLNITLMKDGRNQFFRHGEKQVSPEAYWFIGGILRHGKALSALANPTVNSYKRLLAGFQAPDRLVWASKGERAFVKLKTYPDDAKVELRFPDGSANPYLVLAACIAAGMDGIEKQMDPGEDASVNKVLYQTAEPVANNLREAVLALEQDEVLKAVLGEELTSIIAEIKYKEWEEFMSSVSQWELDRYLIRT
ncbi:MAG: glutamine synthetase family protein [Lachnospiraceae bacterium]|nr:glutamine synthetase family protein [Lachnospiraceae bacterium]